MAELERYAELSREKDLLNERWDEQHTVLVESHERVVQEITQEYEIRIHVSGQHYCSQPYCRIICAYLLVIATWCLSLIAAKDVTS